jgi:hypothetical protein
MPMVTPASPDDRPKGWLISVQTTKRLDWYAVGTSDIGDAHALVAEYCQATLSHAVRLERPLTDGEIDRLGLKQAEVKPFANPVAPYSAKEVSDMRPMGWLISVEAPSASYRQLYATVANSYEQARLQVFNHCSITSETIRLERILTEGEIKQLGLQPGEVKLCAT